MILFSPRKECFIFSAQTGKWKEVEEPAPVGLAFRQLSPHSSKALRYLLRASEPDERAVEDETVLAVPWHPTVTVSTWLVAGRISTLGMVQR